MIWDLPWFHHVSGEQFNRTKAFVEGLACHAASEARATKLMVQSNLQ